VTRPAFQHLARTDVGEGGFPVSQISDVIEEPAFETGQRAEAALQAAMMNALDTTLRPKVDGLIIIESFGLDISLFLSRGQLTCFRQLELKAYVGGRPDGVGFGNQQGHGPQVDLLWDHRRDRPRAQDELGLLDTSIRWVMAFGLLPSGSARYALFTCAEAQGAAMGGVRPGKQNNLRVSALGHRLLTWQNLLREVQQFILSS